MRFFRGTAPSPRPEGPAWSVDVETTGLYPRTDRIVEIVVVRLDVSGQVLDEWTTLLDPQRDVGASHIHGIRGRDVVGAPSFADIAGELFALLSGTVVVGHHSRFDSTFLHAETSRASLAWGPVDGLSTVAVALGRGLVAERRLEDVCRRLGIPLATTHSAADDAHAVAAVLGRLLPIADHVVPRPAPRWPIPSEPARRRLKTDPPPRRVPSQLGSLASRVGIPSGLEALTMPRSSTWRCSIECLRTGTSRTRSARSPV